MDYQTYHIALSPDLYITPEEFAAAWNGSAASHSVTEARLTEAQGAKFIDPALVVGVLLSIPAGVASSALYDFIKATVRQLRDKKSAPKPEHKHMHIEEIKNPDGTRILVVDIDEGS